MHVTARAFKSSNKKHGLFRALLAMAAFPKHRSKHAHHLPALAPSAKLHCLQLRGRPNQHAAATTKPRSHLTSEKARKAPFPIFASFCGSFFAMANVPQHTLCMAFSHSMQRMNFLPMRHPQMSDASSTTPLRKGGKRALPQKSSTFFQELYLFPGACLEVSSSFGHVVCSCTFRF